MRDSTPQVLSQTEAVEQIAHTISTRRKGEAPFVLVLGAGFSSGLVPTTREIVEDSLPLWIKSLEGREPFEKLALRTPAERRGIAQGFWRRFVEKNSGRRPYQGLMLDSHTGLPENVFEAYKSAFSPRYTGAVGAPADARRFQRALIRFDRPRLNAAHFLLGLLLGVQPDENCGETAFKTGAAFSRLILTTNFDPFLQISLQAVNRLYFMSDTPELGVTDDILDRSDSAIHLAYLHGSIHRRSQAATDEYIQRLKQQNASALAPVLKRHGVIVIGYSGWDDTIVEALATSHQFDHRLYWCGRSDPFVPGAYGPRVPGILREPSAAYVKIESAGALMKDLCNGLMKERPPLLVRPIGRLRELLEPVDLQELKRTASGQTASQPGTSALDGRPATSEFDYGRALRFSLLCLEDAERTFQRGIRAKEILSLAGRAGVKHDYLSFFEHCARLWASLGLASRSRPRYSIFEDMDLIVLAATTRQRMILRVSSN